MHLGSGRTALYNYLLAKQSGGKFILRIEDTDQKRYVQTAEQELIDGLHWMGIQWDEGPDIGGPFGPYRQSERKETYQRYAEQLVEAGKAYHCFCTPERLEAVRQEQMKRKEQPRYDGRCRDLPLEEARRRIAAGERYVIRFKTPRQGNTTVSDLLRGPITVENNQIDDAVLIKSNGLAVYHLAAMADDFDMQITHVFRGAEWLPSLPLHAMIMRAFGWPEPVFIHLSLFLKPSGKGKMSKRESAELSKDGHSIFVTDLREMGYLPEAVNNWVALMGWSYDGSSEFFTLKDLEEKFSLDHLNPSPAAINFAKFDHFNGLHIRALSVEELAARIQPFFSAAGIQADLPTLMRIAPLIRERITTLDEAVDFGAFFFKAQVEPNPEELVAKGLTAAQSLEAARSSLAVLEKVGEITPESAEPPMRVLVEELGMNPGQVFGVLRVAVTGQKVSPPLFESMEIIGKERVLERVRRAIALLETL
jgi:glutamyl-tRNA synthetase